MIKRFKERIAYLRTQPEDVRFRAAVYMTIAGGLILVAVWLVILLPLQLYFGRTDDAPEDLPTQQALNQLRSTGLPDFDSFFGPPSEAPLPDNFQELPLAQPTQQLLQESGMPTEPSPTPVEPSPVLTPVPAAP
jgi:hypothetical protein